MGVMGEWAVGYWMVGVTSFQKIYGLYGLKRHIVEISGDVTKAGRDGRTDERTRKDRATQLLNRETLSFAIQRSSPLSITTGGKFCMGCLNTKISTFLPAKNFFKKTVSDAK